MFICDRVMNRDQLAEIAQNGFGDMVKGVVDVKRCLLALDADLHADLEAYTRMRWRIFWNMIP